MSRQPPRPRQADYSPTEVALILKRGRATVYNWLTGGKIAFTRDADGDYRIPHAELERMEAELSAPPGSDKDLLLRQARMRAIAKSNGHLHASRYTREEIAAPMAAGRRRAYENQVDPEHTLRTTDPVDFERRVEQAELGHMEKMRAAWLQTRLRASI